MGFVALLNDLHKGRDSGRAWSFVIDLSAVLMALVSLSGLVLVYPPHRSRARRQRCELMSWTGGKRQSSEPLLGKATRKLFASSRVRYSLSAARGGTVTDRWAVPIRVWPFGLWFHLVGPFMLVLALPSIVLLRLPMLPSGLLILVLASVTARRSFPVVTAAGGQVRIRSLFRTRSFDVPLRGTVRWSRFGALLIITPKETIRLWGASRIFSSYQYSYGYGRLRSVLDGTGLVSEV